MLSEARVTENINTSEIEVHGYNIIRVDSESRHTGGVVIYIQNRLKYNIISEYKVEPNCWMLFIKIWSYNESLGIGTLYHSIFEYI